MRCDLLHSSRLNLHDLKKMTVFRAVAAVVSRQGQPGTPYTASGQQSTGTRRFFHSVAPRVQCGTACAP